MKRTDVARAMMAVIMVGLVAEGQGVDITIRHAPHVVSTVSSKTEKAQTSCKHCGTSLSYERTYKWDVYNHVWIETTNQTKVPTVCKSCAAKEREIKKLEAQKRKAELEIARLKAREAAKKAKQEAARLRNAK